MYNTIKGEIYDGAEKMIASLGLLNLVQPVYNGCFRRMCRVIESDPNFLNMNNRYLESLNIHIFYSCNYFISKQYCVFNEGPNVYNLEIDINVKSISKAI